MLKAASRPLPHRLDRDERTFYWGRRVSRHEPAPLDAKCGEPRRELVDLLKETLPPGPYRAFGHLPIEGQHPIVECVASRGDDRCAN